MAPRLPALPKLLKNKIYKTGQTRGADDDEIYQNRVNRNSTVLIPYAHWGFCSSPPEGEDEFERGFIALISPDDYFNRENITQELTDRGLSIGINALVFYETRAQWNAYNPDRLEWIPATERNGGDLNGQYVARVPGNTSIDGEGEKINRGFTGTRKKGAGIRVYEYASGPTIHKCRDQLEALFWMCVDSLDVAIANGMTRNQAESRKASNLEVCFSNNLLDYERLIGLRILNAGHETICPLCLQLLSAQGFFNRMVQAEGREVLDLTITELNLFHINELRVGCFNHLPYNLGWGHHHCNVVVKDAGISQTLTWMDAVLQANIDAGHFPLNNPI